MSELISVIIPTYKRNEKLLRALSSVLKQTYKNFEIIIVNDDIEDNDLQLDLKKIKDSRIVLYNNERGKGANGARNTGVLKSKGKYIAFLDDDDEWLPYYLKNKFEKLDETDENIGLALCNYFIEDKIKWKQSNIKPDIAILPNLVKGEISIGASSNIFMKRTVIDTIGLWDEALLRQQDLDFVIRVLDKYGVTIDNRYDLKVYGHNEPNPKKAFVQREVFTKKVEKYISKLNIKDIDQYYSNHFRRQANYLVQLKEYNKAFHYWYKGFKHKPISHRKDIKILISLIKNIY